jgi:Mor family transcriptional regulator
MPLTRIPEEQWKEVARRNVAGASLRLLAKDYDVSHEAIRQVIRKVRERT